MNDAPTVIPAPLLDALRAARFVSVLTGAGASAESGVPTFRDAQTGLWAQFDPLELATPAAFARNPKRVWDWYAMRREMAGRVTPNPAHVALAVLERRVPEFVLITQNVDGLHQRAGSRRVVELHGNITRVRCSRDGTPAEHWDDTDPAAPPHCATCGAFLRPDVVWFEEMLPEDALADAADAASRCDVLLVVGTSAGVYPAAALPMLARRHGAQVVEINTATTPFSAQADHALRGKAGVVLPALVAAVWSEFTSSA